MYSHSYPRPTASLRPPAENQTKETNGRKSAKKSKKLKQNNVEEETQKIVESDDEEIEQDKIVDEVPGKGGPEDIAMVEEKGVASKRTKRTRRA